MFCVITRFKVAAVVQLVRMPPCHGGGRGFEPRPLRHLFSTFLDCFFACFFHIFPPLFTSHACIYGIFATQRLAVFSLMFSMIFLWGFYMMLDFMK